MELLSRRDAGAWSFTATFLILFYIGYSSSAFSVVVPDLLNLVTLQAGKIVPNNTSFMRMIEVACAALVIDYVLCMAATLLSHAVAGPEVGRHLGQDRASFLETMYANFGFKFGKSLYRGFIVMMLAEELYARVLFLGVLPAWNRVIMGGLAWYLLFVIGNGSWSLFHLTNFTDKKDWNPIRTLPQFVSGVIFTYFYVKWGFIAAVLIHVGANSLLFSAVKAQRTTMIDFIIAASWFVLAVWSWSALDKPVSDILPWFRSDPQFVLEGWTHADYVNVSLTIGGFINGLLGFLLYDRHNIVKDLNPERDLLTLRTLNVKESLTVPLVALALLGAATIGISIGAVAGMKIVISMFYPLTGSVPLVLMMVSLLLSLRAHAESVSAIARVFWTELPAVYITGCVVLALGNFWEGTFYVLEMAFWTMPLAILKLFDD